MEQSGSDTLLIKAHFREDCGNRKGMVQIGLREKIFAAIGFCDKNIGFLKQQNICCGMIPEDLVY